MLKKIISNVILILFISNFIFAKNKIHPALQSAIIPGYGESSLSKPYQSRFFNLLELTLWSTFLGFHTFADHKKSKYKSYAAKYAGTNSENKDHKYWVDIGNYLSLEYHNEEHLRWRQINDIYDQEFNWAWKSKNHMRKFEKMRIESDQFIKFGEYTLGMITLNHIISSINSLYLTKLNDDLKIYSFSNNKDFTFQLLYNF